MMDTVSRFIANVIGSAVFFVFLEWLRADKSEDRTPECDDDDAA